MKTKTITKINIILFSLILLLHLMRIIIRFPVEFNNKLVPLWINYLGIVIIIIFIYLNFKILK